MQKIICKLLRRSSDSGVFHSKSESVSLGASLPHLINNPSSPEEVSVNTILSSQMASESYAWLHSVAPAFPINAKNIQILENPSEFYQTLLDRCSKTKYRIVLASLYLGTGNLERKLVDTIGQRMRELQGQLKVTFLFDHSRGSRGQINSRTMVTPLLQEQPDTCQVSLYHTVALRGLLRVLTPQRYNELIGLQHMKLYLFDDTLIISGANLSHDYFTNRQDRYVVINDCRDLADFYANLVSRVCEFSFQLLPCGNTSLHSSWSPQLHPYKGQKHKFIEEAHSRVWSTFFSRMSQPNLKHREADTWVFPLVQMNQLGLRHDSEVTKSILESSAPGSHVHLTTGYFNLTKELVETILHKSSAKFSLLSAHPSANGFLNAKGPAGGIPAAYTQLSREFFERVHLLGSENRIHMYEFIRPKWTYHGKGLWLTLPGDILPSLTLIGSPNFGSRSVERDLETQIAILTSNYSLQKRLAEERDNLFKESIAVNQSTFSREDRVVPIWVYCISWLFRNLF